MLVVRALLVVPLIFPAPLGAQAPAAPAAANAGRPAPERKEATARAHAFWDRENILLFAGVTGVRMLDYASTRHLRDQGNDEILLTNAIVDNLPLFVGIELAGAAASIGVSYLFHRSGHHRLERWTSVAHIGVGVFGSVRNYSLKPPTAGVASRE